MENLILLLEEYWGLTIVSGVTVGSIITLAIMAVRFYFSMRRTQKQSTSLTQDLRVLLKERELQAKKIELDSRITASIFKSLSYLVVSSKLPIEDKIALNEDFLEVKKLMEVSKELTREYASAKLEQIASQVQERGEKTVEMVKDVKEVVIEAVEGASTLLDKYTGSK